MLPQTKTHAPDCSELLIRQTIRAFVLRPEISCADPSLALPGTISNLSQVPVQWFPMVSNGFNVSSTGFPEIVNNYASPGWVAESGIAG